MKAANRMIMMLLLKPSAGIIEALAWYVRVGSAKLMRFQLCGEKRIIEKIRILK